MTDWKQEICAEMPPESEPVGGSKIIQRRNITQRNVEATDIMPRYSEYVCECRFMTEDEFNMLKSIEDIDTADAIDAYTEQLIEEGVL